MSNQTLGWSDIMSAQVFEIIMHSGNYTTNLTNWCSIFFTFFQALFLYPIFILSGTKTLMIWSFRHWQEQGYLIIYVTSRPDFQKHKVMLWMAEHNFPFGLVSFCGSLSTVDIQRHKGEYLQNLTNNVSSDFCHCRFGYSNNNHFLGTLCPRLIAEHSTAWELLLDLGFWHSVNRIFVLEYQPKPSFPVIAKCESQKWNFDIFSTL